MKITILAIGKNKGPTADLCAEYAKRMGKGMLTVRELSGADQRAECAALLEAVPDKAIVVLMDERGKDLSSRELAEKMTFWQEQGKQDLVFIIGGADGLTDELRARGDFMLGLGRKTWPHMLARTMLIEQLYRAQLINMGHPYHRD